MKALLSLINNYQGDIGQWLRKYENTEQKMEILYVYFLTNPELYRKYLDELDSIQKVKIEKNFIGRTSFGIFKKLAIEKNIPSILLEKARPESFHFVKLIFPKEGREFVTGETEKDFLFHLSNKKVVFKLPFEVGNIVTQLEYYIVTGKVPSHYHKASDADGDYEVVNGHEMNINHPVESLSLSEAEEYCKILSQRDPLYQYRLLTDSEWELMARGGTRSVFSYGDDPQKLHEYAWYFQNSMGRTHAIAEKKPNPLGLFDVHGNVEEMTLDKSVRGGCVFNAFICLQSEFRGSLNPYDPIHKYRGFRVVRVRK